MVCELVGVENAKHQLHTLRRFSCGHVVPSDNLVGLTLPSGPTRTEMRFVYSQRSNPTVVCCSLFLCGALLLLGGDVEAEVYGDVECGMWDVGAVECLHVYTCSTCTTAFALIFNILWTECAHLYSLCSLLTTLNLTSRSCYR
jgi:hypothetical protein